MENTKRKIFSGFIWKFSERILAQLISFIVSVVLARIMMPEHYGIVAMVTVFINIANVFVTSGFSTALIQKKDASESDFSTIFWCSLVVSIIIYFLMFFSAPLIASYYREENLIWIIRVFAIKIIISAYNSIQHAYVSRHMLFKKFFYSTLFGTLISGIVGIVMALKGFGVWALVAQYLTNSTIDTIVLAITIPWHPRARFSGKTARQLMGYGWKILAADLLGTVYNNLRQLLIGRYFTSSELAYYNKGKQMPELLSNNIDSTVTTVLFPAMSNEHSDKNRLKHLTRKSISFSSYIMFPVMIGLASIARPLINLLLTEKWESSVIYLQIICLAKAIATISNANIQAMKAIGRSDIVLKLEAVKKPFGVIMILVALRWSVLAVAITMPVYSLYAALVNMKPNKQLLDYSMREQIADILPSFLLSIIMFGVISTVNVLVDIPDLLLILVDVVVGSFSYFGLSYIFKVESFNYCYSLISKKLGKKVCHAYD